MLNLVRLACSFGLAFSSLGSGRFVDPHNDSGNGAAAKNLRFQNPRHRRLPFTAWLSIFAGFTIVPTEDFFVHMQGRLGLRNSKVKLKLVCNLSGAVFTVLGSQ